MLKMQDLVEWDGRSVCTTKRKPRTVLIEDRLWQKIVELKKEKSVKSISELIRFLLEERIQENEKQ